MKRMAITLLLLVSVFFVAITGVAFAGVSRITGTVTPTAIAPEVRVCLVESRPSETCTSPGPGGEYELTGVPLGADRIEFIPSYRSRYAIQYFDQALRLSEASTIYLSSSTPERSGVDAALELGAAIEGTVTAASGGTPLADVEVCVLEAGRRLSYGCTDTDAAGGYQLGGLSPGIYKVGFWGHGESAEYAPQYYDGEGTLAEATAIPLAASETATEVDAALAKGARVEGRVLAAAGGAPLENTTVCLFPLAAATPSQCTYSGIGGAYSLLGIPAGSYQVGFSLAAGEVGGEASSSEEDGYLTQYYDNVSARSQASTLMLSGPQAASGIDAHLLTPAAPQPPVPPAVVSNPVTAAPANVAIPTPATPTKCKRGFARKKVKGTYRCVKVTKKKGKGKGKKHRHRGGRQKGERNS